MDSTGQTATTAADGTYTIPDVAPGTYNLTASLANYSDATATNVTVGPGEAVTDVNLTLVELNGTVSGTVTNSSDGTALANATVEVVGTGQTATTDATGNYTITNVTPGTYDVHADAPGYVAETQTNVTVPANGSATANFSLDPADGSITGTVLDDANTTVENVQIDAGNTSTTTDANGTYSLDVAFGNYTVTADKAGYDNDSATVTVNASATPVTQNFTLVAQNGSISGTVTDDAGQALDNATVEIDSTGQNATTDATGAYTIPDVEPGTYNLTASKTGYDDAVATTESVGPGEDRTIDFSLAAQNGSIAGTVTDQDGDAVDNATVTINETGQNTTTNATGVYTIPNIEPGTYNLTATKMNYDAGMEMNVTVGPGEILSSVDLAMTAQNGSIAGTVVNESGGSLANATVTIDETGQNATTNATGAYLIDNVTPGTYNLSASGLSDYDSNSTQVTVDPGETLTNVTIILSESSGGTPPPPPPPPPSGGGGPTDPAPPVEIEAAVSVEPVPAMVGENVQLSGAKSTISSGSISEYSWRVDGQSLDGQVVTVTFDEPGTYVATLTARDGLGNSNSASGEIEVIAIESIEATIGDSQLQVGNTTDITVEATYTDGTTEDITDEASYTSSDEDVISVAGSTLTAEGAGDATIDVQYEGMSDSVTVTVEAPEEPEGRGLHLLGLIIALMALLSGGFILIRNWA
ncbi:MAG: carboxypeptidase regulatory-like domain-containing protein [Natrialbaceae archaeon]|nr:carboxypeptidase regulatory-like domain-containing protein [Natrialbaceae archaeon]